MREARKHGVPIDVNTWRDLQKSAALVGMRADDITRHAALARPAQSNADST